MGCARLKWVIPRLTNVPDWRTYINDLSEVTKDYKDLVTSIKKSIKLPEPSGNDSKENIN